MSCHKKWHNRGMAWAAHLVETERICLQCCALPPGQDSTRFSTPGPHHVLLVNTGTTPRPVCQPRDHATSRLSRLRPAHSLLSNDSVCTQAGVTSPYMYIWRSWVQRDEARCPKPCSAICETGAFSPHCLPHAEAFLTCIWMLAHWRESSPGLFSES